MAEGTAPRRIDGGCHCGNIRLTFDWPPGDGSVIPVRACGCSFCRKHGGVYTSHPQGSVAVTIRSADRVNAYRFGTGTAEFHICRHCGAVPVVTSEIDGNLYAVVNVNCFESVDSSELAETPVDFEGEGTADRLERRKRNWIPEVTFVVRG